MSALRYLYRVLRGPFVDVAVLSASTCQGFNLTSSERLPLWHIHAHLVLNVLYILRETNNNITYDTSGLNLYQCDYSICHCTLHNETRIDTLLAEPCTFSQTTWGITGYS